MTKYELALKEANRILGDDLNEEDNPQVKSLLREKENLQKRIDQIDNQRKPLILRMQDINKRLTLLGKDITA